MVKMQELLKNAEKKQSGAVRMTKREFDRIKRNTGDVTEVRSPEDVQRIEKLEKQLEDFENRLKCVEAQSRETFADLKQRQRASQED